MTLLQKLLTADVVCKDCGTKYGKYSVGCSSTWNGTCGVCGEDKPVTEVRDWGYLSKGIHAEKAKIKEQSLEVTNYIACQEEIASQETDNHPIRPPHELVQQWVSLACENEGYETWQDLATEAARWGADMELEACINYFLEYDSSWGENSELITGLRAARRPKPPSLKEQALALLDDASDRLDAVHENIIRRALEQLDG